MGRRSRWPRCPVRPATWWSWLYATDEAIRDGIDFYSLSGFSLVICKPDKKIIYADCQWSKIQESATLGSMVLEKVTLVASRRIETGV